MDRRFGQHPGSLRRFDPSARLGENACPFTALYWDFLLRHEKRFARNPRMALQVRNLQRLEEPERRDLRAAATKTRAMAIG